MQLLIEVINNDDEMATMAAFKAMMEPILHQNYDAEVVWKGAFNLRFNGPLLFRQVRWELVPSLCKPCPDAYYPGDWSETTLSAKVRFICKNCGHAWTSGSGVVQLWAAIRPHLLNPLYPTGYLAFRLYGQNCQHCGLLNDALWYDTEIARVIWNAYAWIDLDRTIAPISRTIDKVPTDGTAKREIRPHDFHRCEACQNGLQHQVSITSTNSSPPPGPSSSKPS